MPPADPAVVALVRTVADLLTRWADAHTRPPEPPPDDSAGDCVTPTPDCTRALSSQHISSPGEPLLPKD